MSLWNNFNLIKKTRKDHICAATSVVIPKGSSCHKYIGIYEYDFQSWYICNEAIEFMDKHPELFGTEFECTEIGDRMREANEWVKK